MARQSHPGGRVELHPRGTGNAPSNDQGANREGRGVMGQGDLRRFKIKLQLSCYDMTRMALKQNALKSYSIACDPVLG